MKNCNYRNFGKWSAFCAALAVFAASGQACPPEMPVPASSLTGVWTGPVSGEATVSTRFDNPSPPNPTDQTSDSSNQIVGTAQIVFDDGLQLVSAPLTFSAFFGFPFEQAVTVFGVGETQTIANTFTNTQPFGPTYALTDESSNTTTLTVVESVVTMDHFRVVYETAQTSLSSRTSTVPMFTPSSGTQTSTGILTLDATVVAGQLMFSADFNINGSSENISGATTRTGSGFVVGSVAGTLAAN